MTVHGPASLRIEHAQLHAELTRATRETGALGEAAYEVARALHAHFEREEQYAMPPLALLPKLAWDGATAEMLPMLAICRKLKAELPQMLLEHKDIVAALERFKSRALEARRDDYVRLADALILHAQNEEEVSYPAAVLVGEYLEMKLGAHAT